MLERLVEVARATGVEGQRQALQRLVEEGEADGLVEQPPRPGGDRERDVDEQGG